MDKTLVETIYPEYTGETWTHRRLPEPEKRIADQLESLDTVEGKPRFRVVDASIITKTEKADGEILLEDTTTLKYPYWLNKPIEKGWMYRQDGSEIIIDNPSDAPDNAIVAQVFDHKTFGIPRYAVEVYRSVSEPNIKESGYTFGWFVENKILFNGQEISHFRPLSQQDVKYAEKCLYLIRNMSKSDIAEKSRERIKEYASN